MLAWLRNLFWQRGRSNATSEGMSLAEIEALLADESKLVRAKRKWVQEQRFLTPEIVERSCDRLPPGQHLTESFPVLDLGIRPTMMRDDWHLELAGEVERPVILGWRDFAALAQIETISDIHCVTSWSRYDNRWSGVSTEVLVALCSPTPGVTAVMIEAYDGYKTNLRIEDFTAETSLVAHSWSGEPLSEEHGGPVRLVVPHLYFWKSAKWIRKITFLNVEERGFWEVGGYHLRGDPWLQERYRGSEKID